MARTFRMTSEWETALRRDTSNPSWIAARIESIKNDPSALASDLYFARVLNVYGTEDDYPAWIFAASQGNLAAMEIMAPYVNQQQTSREGVTALEAAAEGGALPVVQALVERWGVNPATPSEDGVYAMTIASQLNDHESTIDYLASVSGPEAVSQAFRRVSMIAEAMERMQFEPNTVDEGIQEERWKNIDRLAGFVSDRDLEQVEQVFAWAGPENMPIWAGQREKKLLKAAMNETPSPLVMDRKTRQLH